MVEYEPCKPVVSQKIYWGHIKGAVAVPPQTIALALHSAVIRVGRGEAMTMAPNNGYLPILNLIDQARQAQAAGLTIPALAMVYVGIDTMAWLGLPVDQEKQGRQDFYRWVDTYLKADTNQPYQYVGRDLYAARCAVLHQFATVAELHRQANPPNRFGYVDNGQHMTDGTRTCRTRTSSPQSFNIAVTRITASGSTMARRRHPLLSNGAPLSARAPAAPLSSLPH